jgi:hypothetical protein
VLDPGEAAVDVVQTVVHFVEPAIDGIEAKVDGFKAEVDRVEPLDNYRLKVSGARFKPVHSHFKAIDACLNTS